MWREVGSGKLGPQTFAGEASTHRPRVKPQVRFLLFHPVSQTGHFPSIIQHFELRMSLQVGPWAPHTRCASISQKFHPSTHPQHTKLTTPHLQLWGLQPLYTVPISTSHTHSAVVACMCWCVCGTKQTCTPRHVHVPQSHCRCGKLSSPPTTVCFLFQNCVCTMR